MRPERQAAVERGQCLCGDSGRARGAGSQFGHQCWARCGSGKRQVSAAQAWPGQLLLLFILAESRLREEEGLQRDSDVRVRLPSAAS